MDKQIEKERYNNASEKKLNNLSDQYIQLIDGSSSYADYLRTPYIHYENLLNETINNQSTVLDLCCGDGIHSIYIARLGAKKIIATDIAENSIKLANIRAEEEKLLNIEFRVGDAENLDFPPESFDVVCCVGSLSYVDLSTFLTQVKKVLKPDGKFICVDSFNHNPVYRLNRYVHYLKRERTYSTLERMPTMKTLKSMESYFSTVETNFFGIFSFLGPLISKIVSPQKTQSIIDSLDNRFSFLRKFSFKIVIIATK